MSAFQHCLDSAEGVATQSSYHRARGPWDPTMTRTRHEEIAVNSADPSQWTIRFRPTLRTFAATMIAVLALAGCRHESGASAETTGNGAVPATNASIAFSGKYYLFIGKEKPIQTFDPNIGPIATLDIKVDHKWRMAVIMAERPWDGTWSQIGSDLTLQDHPEGLPSRVLAVLHADAPDCLRITSGALAQELPGEDREMSWKEDRFWKMSPAWE